MLLSEADSHVNLATANENFPPVSGGPARAHASVARGKLLLSTGFSGPVSPECGLKLSLWGALIEALSCKAALSRTSSSAQDLQPSRKHCVPPVSPVAYWLHTLQLGKHHPAP